MSGRVVRRVLAIVDDLMVRSRLEVARPDATELLFLADPADLARQLEPPPDLVLVGLAATRADWEALVRAIRAGDAGAHLPIVAFGPHKDLELRRRALAAGVDRVLANSALQAALPGLLRGEAPPAEAQVGSE